MFTCPECEREINQASELCPYCGADLTASVDGASGEAAKKPKLTKAVFLWAMVLAMLWGIAWFAVPWRMAGSRPAAESRARDAIASVQETLAAYQSSENTFPATLEAIGDSARNAAQLAQSVQYALQYTPGEPEADGRVKSYTLLARAGNFGYLNFYTDETRVLRATRDDRPATAQDPSLGAGH